MALQPQALPSHIVEAPTDIISSKELASHSVQVKPDKEEIVIDIPPAEIVTKDYEIHDVEIQPDIPQVTMENVAPYSAEIETKGYESHDVQAYPEQLIKDMKFLDVRKSEDKFLSKATAMHSYD